MEGVESRRKLTRFASSRTVGDEGQGGIHILST